MSSLKDCLKKNGLDSHYKAIISGAADGKDDNEEVAAAAQAAQGVAMELLEKRETLASQVEADGGKVPEVPLSNNDVMTLVVPLTIPAGQFGDMMETQWQRDKLTFPRPKETVNIEQQAKAGEEISEEEAQKRLEEWKAHARAQGDAGVNAGKVVLSLFDASGVWSQPWADAGYDVFTFDLSNGQDINDFNVESLTAGLDLNDVHVVLAAPPCTDFASVAAQHWKEKDADGRTAASVELVRQVLRTVELFRPAVWSMENPVGRIADVAKLPKPLLQFQPNNFGDPHTKRTQLWGDFETNLPLANVHPSKGSIIPKLSGKDKYTRSLTPEGFAYAFFMANNLHDLGVAKSLARQFKGVPLDVLQEAVDRGMSEADIKSAVEDAYYDYDLERAVDELKAAMPEKEGGADDYSKLSKQQILDRMRALHQKEIQLIHKRSEEATDYADFAEDMAAIKAQKDALAAAYKEKTGNDSPIPTTDKPLADKGLNSYRYAGRYGWIMVGAKDVEGALKEAQRSTDDPVTIDKLQAWTGSQYEPVTPPENSPPAQAETKTPSDPTARPVVPPSEPGFENLMRRQAAVATQFARFLATLPESTLNHLPSLSAKINASGVGQWARIERDRYDRINLDFYEPDGSLGVRIDAGKMSHQHNPLYIDGAGSDPKALLHHIVSLAGNARQTDAADWQFDLKAAQDAAAAYKDGDSITRALERHGLLDGTVDVPVVETPAEEKPDAAPLSEVVDSVNAKHGEGLTDADRILTVDDVGEFINDLQEGKATLARYKAMFQAVLKSKDAILDGLNTKTKDKLLRMGGFYFHSRYKNEKKDAIIKALWENLVNEFALHRNYGPTSYMMTRDGFDNYKRLKAEALAELVANTTDEALQAYNDQRRENEAEAAQRRANLQAAIDNPQTLDDFRLYIRAKVDGGMSLQEARMSLSLEQRIKYDDLSAEASRSARLQGKEAVKAAVHVAAQTSNAKIVEGQHTKRGYPLWFVQLDDKVDTDSYHTMLSTAKRMGADGKGYVNKRQAVQWRTQHGFPFDSLEKAQAFLKYAAGDAAEAKEMVRARRDAFADDRSQTAAQRLNEMAERLEEQANESLSAERKTNTARRARFAAAAEAGASAQRAMARTMRNIAAGIENGTAKFLDKVRQKVQVEMLNSMLTSARWDELAAKYPSYSEQEKHRGEAPTVETADFIRFPSYTADRGDLARMGRELSQLDGGKLLGQRVLKLANDITDEYQKFAKENLHRVSVFSITKGEGENAKKEPAVFPTADAAERAIARSGFKGKATTISFKRGQHLVIMGPSMAEEAGLWKTDTDKRITLPADLAQEIVEKGKTLNRYRERFYLPWQFVNAYDQLKRFYAMGLETAPELRAAMREFIRLREQPAPPDRVKQLERAMVGRKNDGFDFFPTSAVVAQEMIEAAGIEEGMSVLEPSAGMGHIAELIREITGVEPDVIEIAEDRRELLEAKGFNLVGRDFMDLSPRGFTYGDVFRDKDGVEGIMRGSGGMGSNRVGFIPLGKEDLGPEWRDRDELEGVRKNGSNSGYDRIVMNPPFSDRRDMEHVMHAYELLKPGGRLVAIMGEGVFFGQDKKAQAFREWLDEKGGTAEKLPEGSFMDPTLPVNTSVNARMVVVEKPEAAGEGPVYSMTDQPLPRSAWLSEAEIISAIEPVLQKFGKTKIPVSIVERSNDALPSAIAGQEKGVSSGYVFKGRIYLVREGLADTAAVVRTMFHEMFHYGIRRFMTLPQYIETMRQIYDADEIVRNVANAWAASEEAEKLFAQTKSREYVLARATDEALATIADELQRPVVERVFVKKSAEEKTVIENIRDWLAGFARSLGWEQVARFLEVQPVERTVYSDNPHAMRASPATREFILSMFNRMQAGEKAVKDSMLPYSDPAFMRNASQGKVTDTPAFKRWFGNSKVVDADGKPLVVYHATPADFTEFAPGGEEGKVPGAPTKSGRAMWFSPTAAGIENLSAHNTRGRGQWLPGVHIMPVYLKIERPLVIDDSTRDWVKAVWGENFPQLIGNATLADISADYDGVIQYDKAGKISEIVAFRPDQVKSAVGNDGSFDPDDHSILSMAMDRRQFLAGAGALAGWAAINPVDAFAAPAPKGFADLLKAGDLTGALDWIAKNSGNEKYRALAAQVKALLPKGVKLKVVHIQKTGEGFKASDAAPLALFSAYGLAKIDRTQGAVTIWLRDGDTSGLNESTLLHEAIHAALLARYDNLNVYAPSRDTLGPKAADAAITQYIAVWREFREVAKAEAARDEAPSWLSEPYGNPDEFITYALTSPEFQAWLQAREYKGKTLWERFKDWVKKVMGFTVSGKAPTWLDAALVASQDLLQVAPKDAPDFSTAKKIKSILGDRADAGDTLAHAADWVRNLGGKPDTLSGKVASALGDIVESYTHSQNTFNWWHKTVGSQLHKAKIDRLPNAAPGQMGTFGKVFHLAQKYIDDVSRFGMESADKAPNLLPRMDTLASAVREAWNALGDAKDAEAIAAPIFEGTLFERKNLWGEVIGHGKVWSDDELREMYGLNDKQIGLYKEFRAAVDHSLETLAMAEMHKSAKAAKLIHAPSDIKTLRGVAKFYVGQFEPELKALQWELTVMAGKDPLRPQVEAQIERLSDLMKAFAGRAARTEQLQKEGYAPLMRFGKFTVDVVEMVPAMDPMGEPIFDETGAEVLEPKRIYFGMYEKEKDAIAAARILAEEYPEAEVSRGVSSEDAWQLFGGVNPNSLEALKKIVGEEDEIMQRYYEMAVNNHSALKRLIHRQGIAGFSKDVTRTLASFLLANARATSSALHYGDLIEATDAIPKEKGDVKDEAVKLINYVRDPNEEAGKLRGLLFVQFLGGSIAAALVNLTQTATTTYPFLHQFGVSIADIAQAAKLAGLRMAGKDVGDEVLKKALKFAEEEGVVAPHNVHALMGAAIQPGFTQGRGWRAASHIWGSMFGMAEQFNREVAFIAAYQNAIKQGQKPGQAFVFARNAVRETQFVLSKAARPNFARGTIGATLFVFKQFSVFYLELFKRLPTKEKAIMLGTLILLAGMAGAPGADDLDDLIDTLGQAMGYNTNTKRWKHALVARAFGPTAGNFVMHGVSAFLPLELSTRLGMGNLVPASGALKASNSNRRGEEAMELLGAAGGFFKSVTDAWSYWLYDRPVDALIQGAAPKAIKDIAKAVDIAQSGIYEDSRGRKVTDAGLLDAAVKLVGFQPTSVSQIQRAKGMVMQDIAMARAMESSIAEMWARGIHERNPEVAAKARQMLQDWNRKNPDTPIAIKLSQVQRRVKEMGRPAMERLTGTAPKEMRSYVQDAAEEVTP